MLINQVLPAQLTRSTEAIQEPVSKGSRWVVLFRLCTRVDVGSMSWDIPENTLLALDVDTPGHGCPVSVTGSVHTWCKCTIHVSLAIPAAGRVLTLQSGNCNETALTSGHGDEKHWHVVLHQDLHALYPLVPSDTSCMQGGEQDSLALVGYHSITGHFTWVPMAAHVQQLGKGMKISSARARSSLSVCCVHRDLLLGYCTLPWTPMLGTPSLCFLHRAFAFYMGCWWNGPVYFLPEHGTA